MPKCPLPSKACAKFYNAFQLRIPMVRGDVLLVLFLSSFFLFLSSLNECMYVCMYIFMYVCMYNFICLTCYVVCNVEEVIV